MKKIIVLTFLGIMLGAFTQVDAQFLDEAPLDGLYEDIGVIDKDPVPFPPIRRADVMWQRRVWRVIDFREKMNQPFYYPLEAHNGWRSFIQILMDGLKEDSFIAYDVSTGTDEFLIPISYNEIIARQTESIPRVLTRPYPPYDEYDTIITTEFDPTKVMQLRIKEDWYFDKQRSQLMVRIMGICPVIMKDLDGEEIPEPLFWVYFPDARRELARAQTFNRFNDAERRTYDEVFWKRTFSSYIYKESNVYDRRISEYATGIDALFEAERVKNDIFTFEHDLWEF